MSPYVLGIIVREEVVRVAITDLEGNVIGTGSGISDEASRCGFESSIEEAKRKAEIRQPGGPDYFGAVVLGMDNPGSPDDDLPEMFGRYARPDRLTVTHALRIEHAGALGGRPGIVLEVSDKSSCYGRNEQGEEWIAGGWGHLVWDEGSRYWMGMEGIRAAINGTSELLRAGALSVLQLDDCDALLYRHYLGEITLQEAIDIAPIVCRAAEAGDHVAVDIIRRGAGELAENVLSVARHLTMSAPDIVVIGSMIAVGNTFLRPLTEELHLRVRGCRVVESVLSPVVGACLVGLTQMLGAVPARVVERLALSGS